jgi:enamine deaminase RidA (YjgF/YER057c/UK114 family)
MITPAVTAGASTGDRRNEVACAHKIYSGVGKLLPSKFETRVARIARRTPLEWMAIPLWIGLLCTFAHAADVSRLPLQPDTGFPISAAVTVSADTDTVFLSGAMGPVVDPSAPKDSIAAMGDTETQVTGALTRLQATLNRLGLGMGNVVKMNVFLVGDPSKGGKMDFAGLMAGYTKFFGTKEQPNKPARSAVQVAGLVLPGALVEIELIAARPH